VFECVGIHTDFKKFTLAVWSRNGNVDAAEIPMSFLLSVQAGLMLNLYLLRLKQEY
jgi:hypothetical protein